MRFMVGLVAGTAIGFAIASRLYERELEETRRERTVIAAAMTRHPSQRRIATSSRRLIDLANEHGVAAIRRARETIQRRLEPDVDDLSMN